MSPKNSSLAYDETMKEFDYEFDNHPFEPELKVLVKASPFTASPSGATQYNEITLVKGSITVSF